MARLIGFFLVVLLLLQGLRAVPVIGGIFRVPLFGFWITAILLSAGLSKLAAVALDRRKVRQLARQLGTVDTPHNQGKLGSLLLSQGRFRQACEPLERATAGEPESAEWWYRLGCARIGSRDPAGAVTALERAVEIDEDHAYGGALLRLAEAHTLAGEGRPALEALERFARTHGPNPESAYRRGRALRALGQSSEARAAFAEVPVLAEQVAPYQRRAASAWVARSYLARLL